MTSNVFSAHDHSPPIVQATHEKLWLRKYSGRPTQNRDLWLKYSGFTGRYKQSLFYIQRPNMSFPMIDEQPRRKARQDQAKDK